MTAARGAMDIPVGQSTRTLHLLLRHCVLFLAVVACGGDSAGPDQPTPPLGPPGISFVSGANASDTAGAFLPAPLVIQLRDSLGRSVPNAPLVATSTQVLVQPPCAWECIPYEPSPEWQLAVGRTLNTIGGASSVDLRTDSLGRASVYIQMQWFASNAGVVVQDQTRGLVDTAHFTITPGHPYGALIEPRDTAVYLGSTFSLRAGMADGYDNIISPSGTLTAEPGITVASDRSLTATAYGVWRVIETDGGSADTTIVRVVPHGRIVALDPDFESGFYVFDLDGSNDFTFPGVEGNATGGPSWSPDGSQFVYAMAIGTGPPRLYVQPLTGSAHRVIPNPPSDLTDELWPAWSHDGQWIYFSGRPSSADGFSLWRTSPDGATVQKLALSSACCISAVHASPSPDGSKLAYIDSDGIQVVDLATGKITSLPVSASDVRWSPDGSWLAFGQGIVSPDGNNIRQLSGAIGNIGFDWSPDSKWLILLGDDLQLYQVATGLVIDLPYTWRAAAVSWDPR